MRLENSFEVAAAAETAWELLNDVPRVVPCIPGAELTRVVGEHEWEATVHVSLGPISLRFLTDVKRVEVDDSARRVVLSAKARESRGRGGALATLESSLAGVGSGTTVTVVTDLVLQGDVAQYGRGIVADVAGRMTESFAVCIARRLETAGEEGVEAPVPAVEPVGGLRLGLGALWASFTGCFRRR